MPNAPSASNPSPPSPPIPSQGQTAVVSIVIPSATTQSSSRRPLFVSSGVNGARIQIFAQGTTTPALVSDVYDLSATSTLCHLVSGGRSCTLTINLPIGADTIVVGLFDTAPVSGVIPATAKQLGTASQNQTVVAGSPPLSITVPVLPIVAGVTVSAPTTQFYALKSGQGTQTVPFALLESDASGSVVSGPLATPIIVKVTESGGTGFASLSLGSTTGANQVTLTKSTDAPSFVYTGGGVAGYSATVTFTVQGSSTPPYTEQLSPVFVAPSAPSPLFTAATQTAAMQGWPSSLVLTASAVAAPAGTVFTPVIAPACATVATIIQSGANFTLTGGSSNASGCSVTITMSGGTGSTIVNIQNTPAAPATGSGPVTLGGASEAVLPIALPTPTAPPFLHYGQSALAADGSLWFTIVDSLSGFLQQVVPAATFGSGTLGTPVHVAISGIGSTVIIGPDGNLWFPSVSDAGSHLVDQNVLSTIQSQFVLPGLSLSSNVSGLANGSDGQLWGAVSSPAEFFSASTGGIVLTYSQTLIPVYLVAGVPSTNSANALWALDSVGDILTFAPATPTTVTKAATACVGAPSLSNTPVGMVIDPSGNLWVVNGLSGLSKATIAVGGAATCTPITDTLPGSTGIVALAAGPDGTIWGLDNGVGLVAVLPGTTTAIHAPQDAHATGASYGGLAVDTLGNVWFADASTGKIYEYHP